MRPFMKASMESNKSPNVSGAEPSCSRRCANRRCFSATISSGEAFSGVRAAPPFRRPARSAPAEGSFPSSPSQVPSALRFRFAVGLTKAKIVLARRSSSLCSIIRRSISASPKRRASAMANSNVSGAERTGGAPPLAPTHRGSPVASSVSSEPPLPPRAAVFFLAEGGAPPPPLLLPTAADNMTRFFSASAALF